MHLSPTLCSVSSSAAEYRSSLVLPGHVSENQAIDCRGGEISIAGQVRKEVKLFSMTANSFTVKANLNTGRRETSP